MSGVTPKHEEAKFLRTWARMPSVAPRIRTALLAVLDRIDWVEGQLRAGDRLLSRANLKWSELEDEVDALRRRLEWFEKEAGLPPEKLNQAPALEYKKWLEPKT